MKVIEDIELLKKLQPDLEDVETEYYIEIKTGNIITKYKYDEYLYGECDFIEIPLVGKTEGECKNCGGRLKTFDNFKRKCHCSIWKGGFFGTEWESNIYNEDDFIKTLTTDEALELLPVIIEDFYMLIQKNLMHGYEIVYENDNGKQYKDIKYIGETLLQVIEQMLHYLVDNNLLGNK